MKTEQFTHENVLLDGTFKYELGAIHTDGRMIVSQEDGGCDLEHCKCSEGHWVTTIQPRTKQGIVEGVKITFDNKQEMVDYLNNNNLTQKLWQVK